MTRQAKDANGEVSPCSGRVKSKRSTTLILFALRAVGADTELTVTESGFDQIPLERRADAFKANDGGWAHQLTNIQKHLALRV
jgi:hypothetical protein